MPRTRPKKRLALDLFKRAESAVLEAGYAWEIEWQKQRRFKDFSEQDLLRESAWVILNSGFRESVIRKKFDYISLCFCDWESAAEIDRNREHCVTTALDGFGNARKLCAIARIASIIEEAGFSALQSAVREDPIPQLQKLPFIGPITSWHLAKNLGLDVAKNDRHLERIANYCGYLDAHELCDYLSEKTGQARAVVDIILWRSASLGKIMPLMA